MDATSTAGFGLTLTQWAQLGFTVVVPAVSGLVGVLVGASLSARHDRAQKRLAFVEQQLRDFYSPLLGLRNEIRMRSELRKRVHDEADGAWRALTQEARDQSEEALRALSSTRGPEFDRVIAYSNQQLREELLPAFRAMVSLFRERFWLADSDTRLHYRALVEFVELWERWTADSVPPEVIERLGHSEQNLEPFYAVLEAKHEALRVKIARGKA